MKFGARILGFGLVALAVLPAPVWAQSAAGVSAGGSAGPVHLPPGYSTNAPITTSIAPASTLAGPAPAPNSATNAAPVSPALAATGTSGDDGDIHDIRGVISIPYPILWLLYALGAAALAAALYYGWKWLRRTVMKPKLPHEIALERLEAARALMNEGQVREYAFAVSEAVRLYIEQRFGERAARRLAALGAELLVGLF